MRTRSVLILSTFSLVLFACEREAPAPPARVDARERASEPEAAVEPEAEAPSWSERLTANAWVHHADTLWPTETRWTFAPDGTGRVEIDVFRAVPFTAEIRRSAPPVFGTSRVFSFAMKWALNEEETAVSIERVGGIERTDIEASWEGMSRDEFLKSSWEPKPSKKVLAALTAEAEERVELFAKGDASDFTEAFDGAEEGVSFYVTDGGEGRIKLLKKGLGTLELSPAPTSLKARGLEGDAELSAWLTKLPLELVGANGKKLAPLDVRLELEEGGVGRAHFEMHMPGGVLITEAELAGVAGALELSIGYELELEWGLEGGDALWLRTVRREPVLPWRYEVDESVLDDLQPDWRGEEKDTLRSLGVLADLALSDARGKQVRNSLILFGRVGEAVRLPLEAFEPSKPLAVSFDDTRGVLRHAK